MSDHEAIRKVQAETIRQLEERARLGIPHPLQPMSDAQRAQYRKQASRAHVPASGITTPILTQVSPSLHPQSVEPFKAAGDIVMVAAQRALKSMYVASDAMQTAEQLTRQQHGATRVVNGAKIELAIPYAQATVLAADLGQRFATVARTFDQSLGTITDQIGVLETRIGKALTSANRDPMAAQEASDARHWVAGLAPADRMSALHTADIDVVQACLASHHAAGLSKQQALDLRSLASDRFCKADTDALGAAKLAHTHMLSSSATFLQTYKKLLPSTAEPPLASATKKLKEGA
jgi:hypothetical protein